MDGRVALSLRQAATAARMAWDDSEDATECSTLETVEALLDAALAITEKPIYVDGTDADRLDYALDQLLTATGRG